MEYRILYIKTKGINMKYEMMIPPFKHGKFIDMKKKEVQQYFIGILVK